MVIIGPMDGQIASVHGCCTMSRLLFLKTHGFCNFSLMRLILAISLNFSGRLYG